VTVAGAVLLVCTGNMCRSPMAEVLLKDRLQREGKDNLYRVRSAGTWTTEGRAASRLAIEAMRELGLDLTAHRTHLLTAEDVRQASLILVMAQDHREALLAEFPEAGHRTHLLSELAGQRHDIFDPYGSNSVDLYRQCAKEIATLLDESYGRVLELAEADVEGA
jgi:protein-tyrosine-phosphatase